MAEPKKRLFIAVDVSPDSKRQLAEAQAKLSAVVPDAKWVEPDGLHVTLVFLGYVDETVEASVKNALTTAAARLSPWLFKVGGVGAFPTNSRPRVIWAGVSDGGEFASAASELAAVLTPLGFEPEERPYVPHITLGRIKRPHRLAEAEALTKSAKVDGASQNAGELLLYRSRLSRSGAEYSVEARFPFGAQAIH